MTSITSIVYDFDAEAPIQYAARELARCLEKVQGFRPILTQENNGFCIFLKTDLKQLINGAFRYTVTETEICLQSGTAQGIVYGSYALLEALGCRFIARDCEVFPDVPNPLPLGIHEETPAFAVRELFWREAMDGDFAVKLRLNSARSTITKEQGGKAMFYNFSHTFNQLIPVEKYFDTHPDYFSMENGRRIREKTQLCLTNPDVLKLCVEGVKKWARENPDYNIFSVAMNDWYQPCKCPNCSAVDQEEGSHAGTMIRFVNAVAEEVEKEFPNVMIHTFAYLYCRKPPRIVKPRKNVIVRLCSIECCFAHPLDQCGCEIDLINVQDGSAQFFHGNKEAESSFLQDLRGWSKICENLFIWDYTTNYANYLQPFPNMFVFAENLKTFRKYGVHGMFEQGNFSLGRSSALGQLKIYLLAKLMWNPDADLDELIADFAHGYYGPGAEPMIRYIRLWQKACGEKHAGIYDSPASAYLTPDLLKKAEELLSQAKKLASNAPYLERIEREELSVRYVQLVQMPMNAVNRNALIDQFASDCRRLGISELFERRNLEESFEAMKKSQYVSDRSSVSSITYPI